DEPAAKRLRADDAKPGATDMPIRPPDGNGGGSLEGEGGAKDADDASEEGEVEE
ncbi:MAG: hypothetical protein INR71_07855, partial [Terriglobus roseus]|nr:hypothetical protein [Terriglobus roseus]